MTQEKIDGHEAYRDDPEYTAPEMQPYAAQDVARDASEIVFTSAAGLSAGAGGGALAGQALAEEIEAEVRDTTFNPESVTPNVR